MRSLIPIHFLTIESSSESAVHGNNLWLSFMKLIRFRSYFILSGVFQFLVTFVDQDKIATTLPLNVCSSHTPLPTLHSSYFRETSLLFWPSTLNFLNIKSTTLWSFTTKRSPIKPQANSMLGNISQRRESSIKLGSQMTSRNSWNYFNKRSIQKLNSITNPNPKQIKQKGNEEGIAFSSDPFRSK